MHYSSQIQQAQDGSDDDTRTLQDHADADAALRKSVAVANTYTSTIEVVLRENLRPGDDLYPEIDDWFHPEGLRKVVRLQGGTLDFGQRTADLEIDGGDLDPTGGGF